MSTFEEKSIAVIGMSCRLPGAASLEEYWQTLREGQYTVGEIARDRFDVDAYYDPRPEQPGSISTRKAGMLEDVRTFDASFFGISGREAAKMDPQQRLLLEVVFEALQKAGQPVEELEGEPVGIFTGMIANEYRDLVFEMESDLDVYAASGTSRAAASGRVSHTFGFTGPSLTVDSACSSSLVATHLACESIQSGAADLAVAAGTNLILEPHGSLAFSAAGTLADDGRCKFGDASADGFVRSDGVAAVVLKPLEDAVEAGDPIDAVVRASASNNDGRLGKGFFMTPSPEGQQALLERTYANHRDLRERIDYVEAHGTGTTAGDPVELRALDNALTDGVDREAPLRVGSAKTNIGHTEGAAGVAGLIKAVLALKNRLIPESLHLENPNPEIPWDEMDIEIPTEPVAIAGDEPAVAGVSSFGITGTNAHVVLEEWRGRQAEGEAVDTTRRPRVLPISAHAPPALSEYVGRFEEEVAALGGDESGGSERSVAEVCRTAGVRRSHRRFRVAVTGETADELADALSRMREQLGDGEAPAAAREGSVRTVFAFSGQGGQWREMGGALAGSEPFDGHLRRTLEMLDAVAERDVDCDGISATDWPADLESVQWYIFAVQVALARSWIDQGVEPDLIFGHSLGEVAAAHVAGALSLRDACRVVCARSSLLQSMAGEGAMAVVGMSPEAVREAELTEDVSVDVAVYTGPETVVLSGEAGAIETITAELDERGVYNSLVDVDYASHSAQVEPVLDALRERLEAVRPSELEVPMVSTVLVDEVSGTQLDADYWVSNLRRPVRLAPVVESLCEQQDTAFVEMGPSPVLARSLDGMLNEASTEGCVVGAMEEGREAASTFAEGVARLYELGADIDWKRLAPETRVCSLPEYPLGGDEYWHEADSETGSGATVRTTSASEFASGADRHPFLARTFRVGGDSGRTVWEMPLNKDRFWYLDDHRVRGAAMFPGTGYVEMAAAAGRELFADASVRLESFEFENLLRVSEGEERRLQLIATPIDEERYRAEFYSVGPGRGADSEVSMQCHARAEITTGRGSGHRVEGGADLAGAPDESLDREEFYERLHGIGIEAGPSFRCVDRVDRGGASLRGELTIPTSVARELTDYLYHPVLLDGVFQLVAPIAWRGGDSELFLPSSFEEMILHREPSRRLRSEVVVRAGEEAGSDREIIDIEVRDREGEPVFEIRGLEIQRIRTGSELSNSWIDQALYHWDWERRAGAAAAPELPTDALDQEWLVIDFGEELGASLAQSIERTGAGCRLWGAGSEPISDVEIDPADLGARDPGDLADLLARIEAESGAGLRGIAVVAPRPGETVSPDATTPDATTPDATTPNATTPDANDAAVRGGTAMAAVSRLVAAIDRGDGPDEPVLWFVTSDAQSVGDAVQEAPPEGALLWGFARSLRSEHPDLLGGCLDLCRSPGEGELRRAARWMLAGEEDEVVVRRMSTHFHRLDRGTPVEATGRAREVVRTVEPGEPFEFVCDPERGVEGIHARDCEPRVPGAGEVRIDVRASGLNFKDVVGAIGLTDEEEPTFGFECAGIVRELGDGVAGSLDIGDRVMAFAPKANCFGGDACVDARLAERMPEDWTFEAAATVPTVYLTSYFALVREGRLRATDRVLIHTASGGVGHAALWIAEQFGCEIYATAGTSAKREYVRERFDVEAVLDSRSAAFADRILEATDGEGVDVVLNTLTGRPARRGLELLRSLGRFLDLSKVDLYEDDAIEREPFRRNIQYSAIDITEVADRRPDAVAEMWTEIRRGFESDGYSPLPIDRTFELPEIADAVGYMRQADHVGKIVLERPDGSFESRRPVDAESLVDEEGAYVLTGGTGALGLELAEWLSLREAGRVVLMSRSGIDAEDVPRLERMRKRGTRVSVERGDVTEEADLRRVLETARQSDQALRGVFHLAGVLDDRLVANLTGESIRRVVQPKVAGAWNLHRQTAQDDLDWFVMFSSAATAVGTPGQANYAAANEFLDQLARRRRGAGLPALSIGWGVWRDVGLAAREDVRGERLQSRGLRGLETAEALEALETLMTRAFPARVGLFGMDWSEWTRTHAHLEQSPTYGRVVDGDDGGGEEVVSEAIRTSTDGDRGDLVEEYLRSEVSRVLDRRESSLDFSKPVSQIGLDSLMVVELRTRLENDLGVELSSNNILRSQDLGELTARIVERL